MPIKSTKVFNLFKQFNNRNFVFLRPNGNWGDEMIFRGADKLALLAKASFKTYTYSQSINETFQADSVIYIHGGGGFNTIWDGSAMKLFIKMISSHSGIVILGPTSIERSMELKNTLSFSNKEIKPSKVFVFARSALSLKEFSSIIPSSMILDIDHDTALNLERSDLIKDNKPRITRKVLYAIRNDKEKTEIIKKIPFILWFDPIEKTKNFNDWVMCHDGVSEIVTNRLHSSILGSCLGKKVTLLPNSYYKNNAVWKYSLKDSGVLWLDNLEYNGLFSQLQKLKPYQLLVNSYKVNEYIAQRYLKKQIQ